MLKDEHFQYIDNNLIENETGYELVCELSIDEVNELIDLYDSAKSRLIKIRDYKKQ